MVNGYSACYTRLTPCRLTQPSAHFFFFRKRQGLTTELAHVCDCRLNTEWKYSYRELRKMPVWRIWSLVKWSNVEHINPNSSLFSIYILNIHVILYRKTRTCSYMRKLSKGPYTQVTMRFWGFGLNIHLYESLFVCSCLSVGFKLWN